MSSEFYNSHNSTKTLRKCLRWFILNKRVFQSTDFGRNQSMGRFSRFATAQRQRVHGQPSVSRVHRSRAENSSVRDHVSDCSVLRCYGQIQHVFHDIPNQSRSCSHILQQRTEYARPLVFCPLERVPRIIAFFNIFFLHFSQVVINFTSSTYRRKNAWCGYGVCCWHSSFPNWARWSGL